MIYTPIRRPALDAAALPRPRNAIIRQMRKVAAAINDVVDSEPGWTDPLLDGCLRLPAAEILIAGTACHRPLAFYEADRLAERTGFDVLLVRHDAYRITIDLRLQHMRSWLCGYRRWQLNGDFWLIPDGDGPFVRASMLGLELGYAAPFADAAEREAGLAAFADPVFAEISL